MTVICASESWQYGFPSLVAQKGWRVVAEGIDGEETIEVLAGLKVFGSKRSYQ
jgi:hypothetical protein